MLKKFLPLTLSLFLLAGCSHLVGEHPFSKLPGLKGEKAKKPTIFVNLSVAPQVYADEIVNGHPCKKVLIFVQITPPFNEWEGSYPVLLLNDRKSFVFNPNANHNWVLEAPFGIGYHTLTIQLMKEEKLLHEYTRYFTVYPIPAEPRG
jgi:hypothetical protein